MERCHAVERSFQLALVPNGPIRDYRDLLVWRQAIELALLCEAVCEGLGNGCFSLPDYLRHLSMANKSLRELESHLYFVTRKYGQSPRARAARELSTTVAMLLAGLVRSLRKKNEER